MESTVQVVGQRMSRISMPMANAPFSTRICESTTTCTVLSINKHHASHGHAGAIGEGDVLHLHYRTYDPEETLRLLTDILGDQPEDDTARVHIADENHVTPAD